MRFHRWHSVFIGVFVIFLFGVGIGIAGGVADDPGNETVVAQQDSAQVAIASELANESGEVRVFIQFESAGEGASVGELKTHASESQADFERFAERTEGVTIESEFWITSGVSATVDTDAVGIESLASVQGVTRIQPPVTVEVDSGVATQSTAVGSTPSTPAVGSASVLQSDVDATYGLEQIRAPDAWDAYDTQGEGTSVAVLDTGVDADHPDIDLAGWAEFDEDGNEVDSEPHDGNGHGTHVSGTVSGGDASGQYIGVAPEVELLHGKVLNDDGGGSLDQVIAGMEWAVEEDVDVLTMSLGVEGYFEQFIEPVRNAENAGVTVVASVGNEGEGTSSSPGNIPDSINIGATDANEDVPSFSSGEVIVTDDEWEDPPDDWPDEYVVPTVVAPGVSIYSAEPGGDYDTNSGTSMAAPHVAGAVALVQAATGEVFSNDELESALVETAWKPEEWDEPEDEPDTRYGFGIIDIPATVTSLEDGSETEFAVTEAGLSEETVLEGESIEITGTVENNGDEGGKFAAELTADDTWRDSATVEVEAGESETVTFEETFEDSGEYDIAVDDASAGTLTVEQPATFELSDLTVEPTTILEGESAEMSATVENVGDREGTFTAELQVDEETVDTEEMTLSGGESETVAFEEPFEDAGSYDIEISERDVGTLTVDQPATFELHNATVEPTTILENESAAVGVEVENVGDREGTFTGELQVDEATVQTANLTLAGGENETLTFEEEFAEAGEYEIAVSNESAGTLTVEQSANITVREMAVSPTTVEVNGTVDVNVTVENSGDRQGNFTVELTVEDELVANETVLVEGNDSVVLAFEHTFAESGEYTVAVGTHATTVTVGESELSVDDYRDEDGGLPTSELRNAISDWREGTIDTDLLRDVIAAWREG